MNLLFPRFTLRQFSWMLAFGLAGAVVAGIYGVVHDQVTYTVGPEYFTKLKFRQFHYLDQAQPVRLVVAEIGFLATWWVGFFAAWFMARVTIPHLPVLHAAQLSLRGVVGMILAAMTFALVAAAIAPTSLADSRLDGWNTTLNVLGVTDRLAFLRVAYIHNASYLGGLAGLVGSLGWLKYHLSTLRSASGQRQNPES